MGEREQAGEGAGVNAHTYVRVHTCVGARMFGFGVKFNISISLRAPWLVIISELVICSQVWSKFEKH